MNLKITEFFEVVTYNGLHDYVDLPSNIAAQIVLDDPEHREVFVEPISPILVRCYWPIESWIRELKRRKEIEATLADMSTLPRFTKPIERLEDIQKLIITAAANGNFEEVNKLNERLQKLTSSI